MTRGRPMNLGLQLYKLEAKLASLGFDPDLIDLVSLVDGSLSYPENEGAVLGLVRPTCRSIACLVNA